MSTNFDNMQAADAAAVIGESGETSELITVTPHGGSARPIYAIVTRNPPMQAPGSAEKTGGSGFKRPAAEFLIQIHATNGLLISEIKTGLTVSFKVRKEDAVATTLALKPASDGDWQQGANLKLEA